MEKMLNEFKNKLLDLTTRNRSLCLRKHYKGKSMDMFDFIKYTSVSEENIIDFLLKNTEEFCLLNNIDRMYNKQKDILYKLHLNKISAINESGLDDCIDYINLQNWYNNLNSLSLGLKDIYNTIVYIEKETGKYELYLGYPFVEGVLDNDRNIKAPIWLYPVNICFNNNSIFLKHIPDTNPVINNVFLLTYYQYNNINIKNDVSFENFCIWLKERNIELSDDSQNPNIIDLTIKYLYEQDVFIRCIDSNDKIEAFDELKKDYNNNFKKELFLRPNLVLGQFSLASSLYNDYKHLLSSGLTSDSIENLLLDHPQNINISYNDNLDKDFFKKNFYAYTKLDYSQEVAVTKSINNNLVIYGPPGTGKSETIANIVVDNLMRDKKVLIVSQKKAALDVLANRLNPFNLSTISLVNVYTDKKTFYRQLQKSLDVYENNLSTSLDISSALSNENIESVCNVIDDKIEELNKITSIMHNKISYGLTLHEMFVSTKKIRSVDDDKYKYYMKLFKNNLYLDINYLNLKDALQVFNNNKIVSDYYTLRCIERDNLYILNLKNNLSIGDITIFLDSFDMILDKLINLKQMFMSDIIFKSSLDLFLYTTKTNFDIEEKSKDLNKQLNGHLLEPLNIGSRYNPNFWLKYVSKKKQEKINICQYEKSLLDITNLLNKNLLFLEKEFLNLSSLITILKDDIAENFIQEFLLEDDLNEKLNSIKKSLKLYNSYTDYLINVKNLNALQKDILSFIYGETCSLEEFFDFGRNFLDINTLIQIEIVLKNNNLKSTLDQHADYENILKEINHLYQEKRDLVRKQLVIKQEININNVFTKLKNTNKLAFGNLKKESKKLRCLKSIREFIDAYRDYIFDLYPCWLLNPETVSDVLPLETGLFDVVIFDEASQLLIEKAIPSIYRANHIIVAGDDKQLKPSTLFSSSIDLNITGDFELIEKDDISLLDIAKKKYEEAYLAYHYRSKYEELINFSNYAFYSGQLKVSPNIEKTPNIKPIERIEVNGIWANNSNDVEANTTVSLLFNIFNNNKESSVGIITFNEKQKQLIEYKLEQKAASDSEFRQLYIQSLNKKSDLEDKSLFIKNIENVQGDERDIIIFSTGYAKDENGNVYARFGSLNQSSGENRLNVAISRAKSKIYVITSIKSNELVVSENASSGAILFKKYLQYVELITNNEENNVKSLLYSLCDMNQSNLKLQQVNNNFELTIYNALIDKGLTVHTQVGTSGYSIDLAIYDGVQSKYLLGIECDNSVYNLSKDVREREIYRRNYLQNRGWKIHRVWGIDWWLNPNKEIEKILDKINTI